MVHIERLFVARQKKRIVDSISCSFDAAQITVIIGKSGAGKTTLLQAIAGLLLIEQGSIFIDKNNIQNFSIKERAEHIGYVFQQFNLFSHMTAAQNCIDPLLVHGVHKQAAEKTVLSYFEQFDMRGLIKKYPHQLSGGQQQRVAIIRALCLGPKILLLDEPTASLDPENSNILIEILKKLAKQGITIIISSQDTYFTKKVADIIFFLQNGKILEQCEGNKVEKSVVIKDFFAL